MTKKKKTDKNGQVLERKIKMTVFHLSKMQKQG